MPRKGLWGGFKFEVPNEASVSTQWKVKIMSRKEGISLGPPRQAPIKIHQKTIFYLAVCKFRFQRGFRIGVGVGRSPKVSCFQEYFPTLSLAMWNNPVEQNLFLRSKEAPSSHSTLHNSTHLCTTVHICAHLCTSVKIPPCISTHRAWMAWRMCCTQCNTHCTAPNWTEAPAPALASSTLHFFGQNFF